MIAILHDAIDCLEKYRCATDTHGRRVFQDAKQWLLADEGDWLYSFEFICGFIDLDPTVVRRGLRLTPATQEAASTTAPIR